MSIPDLPTPKEVTGQSKSGLNYHVIGSIQPTVVVDLGIGQSVYSNTGAMSWMSATVDMNTNAGGGLGSMFKRFLSGASLFILDFSVKGVPGQVAFSADFPGKVLDFELDDGQSVIMHKHAFICAEKSVALDMFFTRSLGAGLFSGEGFVLQKLTGPGLVFAELDGDAVEYHLKAGETMRVEPGHVAMFDASVTFDMTIVRGIKNILLGGEGMFLATLTGPGRIWLHSMAPTKVAQRIAEYLPASS